MGDHGERFATLDGIRAVACLLVVALHAPDLFPWVPHPSNAYLAVDLFFCLSGFVIARVYGERLRSGELSPGSFLLSRAIRFYPLYMLGLVLGAIGLPHIWAGDNATLHTVIASLVAFEVSYLPSPLLPQPFILDPPAWSLSAELLVNWVFAWLVARRPVVWVTLAAASMLAVVARAAVAGDIDVGWDSTTLPIGWARAMLMFSIGAVVQRYGWAPPIRSNAIAATIIAAVGAAIAMPRVSAPGAVAFMVVACPLAIYLAARVEPTGVLRTALKFGGQLSYGVYILHLPVIGLIRIYFAPRVLAQTTEETPGFAFMAVLCASVWFLECYYVPPMRRLLRAVVEYLARRPRPASIG